MTLHFPLYKTYQLLENGLTILPRKPFKLAVAVMMLPTKVDDNREGVGTSIRVGGCDGGKQHGVPILRVGLRTSLEGGGAHDEKDRL
eukprot:15365928-Ditylum_brightwellii.AAC.1